MASVAWRRPCTRLLSTVQYTLSASRVYRRSAGCLSVSTIQLSVRSFSDKHDLENPKKRLHYEIPQRVRQKVVSASDAVALVRDGDTVSCSGFVAQGTSDQGNPLRFCSVCLYQYPSSHVSQYCSYFDSRRCGSCLESFG
jgi:propionate CoA-transferase